MFSNPARPNLDCEGADLRTDLPKYRIYEKGVLQKEVEEVKSFFHEGMVSFLLGCSFSFESAMLAAGLPLGT